MAHKTEKEDTEFSIVAETSTTTAAASLCEKRSATVPVTSPTSSKAGKEDNIFRSGASTKQRTFRRVSGADPEKSNCGSTPTVKRAVNRCLTCCRRVGLTGFRCRCGELFCAVHRYSDRHDCGFDYKSAAREAIARENPVVKASKIIKI